MASFIIPVAGYLAFILLAISLIVNDDLKFRWINGFGCLFFVAYGVLIHALPIILTNGFLLVINTYYLIRIYNTYEDFDLIEFNGDEKLVFKFLAFYQADIKKYFPAYRHDQNENHLSFLVLRDMAIANIFVAELNVDGTAFVKLNYTVPKYRDYKIGRYIFDKENKFLLEKGVKTVVYKEVANKGHEKFLKANGFVKKNASKEQEWYVKTL